MTRRVLEGKLANGVAVVRPPGHHAEPPGPEGLTEFVDVFVDAGWCIFLGTAVVLRVTIHSTRDGGQGEVRCLTLPCMAKICPFMSSRSPLSMPGPLGLAPISRAQSQSR